MNANLDSYDRAIIRYLQADSSISNLELSKQIGLSPSACLIRTKNLREEGIIRQFTTIVDEHKLGMDILAFALVDLNPLNRDTIHPFLEMVHSLPQVQECYTLTGQHAFLLKVVERDITSYRDFVIDRLMSCPAVSNVETSMVMGVEKRTTAVPVEME
ncbi:MAG: Lrp/AsnC family transcriptional regulator [Oscillospiraceae bacterium]|nr:Lrp/AsnC family transcriptional regulator [Oscillospiraceae bacterium]